MNRKLTREEVMKLFYEMDMNDDFSIERSERYLNNIENMKIDTTYFRYTSLSFVENLKSIDNLINEYSSDWKINRIAKIDIAIMRLAITEMLYDDGIPISVSINEAIELCKKYSNEDSHKFIDTIHNSLHKLENSELQQSEFKLSQAEFETIENMQDNYEKVNSPLQKLEHSLQYFSIFIIMPIFAFANTGIELSGGNFFSPESATLPLGVVLGFTLGKPIGITLLSYIAVKTKVADLPPGIDFAHILGTGLLAGIGFTMSIFITELAFTTAEFTNTAKLSVLTGSVIAGVAGYFILRAKLTKSSK